MTPLTVEQLQKHPEYEHTIWKLTPDHEGKVTVAKDRGGPINIAYEVHGHGDRKIVVSMPLSILSQLRHRVSDCYFCLAFVLAAGTGVLSCFVSVAWAVSGLDLTSHLANPTLAPRDNGCIPFTPVLVFLGLLITSSQLLFLGAPSAPSQGTR